MDYLYCGSAYIGTCDQRVVVNAMVEFALTLVKARLGRLKKAKNPTMSSKSIFLLVSPKIHFKNEHDYPKNDRQHFCFVLL